MKSQLKLVDQDEVNLRIRRIVLRKDAADLKRFSLTDMPKVEESFEKALVSWISYKNLRKDMTKMLNEYLPNVKKAYKGNDTGKLRELVNSNNNDLQEELLSGIKWHLSNVREEFDAVDERIKNMLDIVHLEDLDTTLTDQIESDLDATLTELRESERRGPTESDSLTDASQTESDSLTDSSQTESDSPTDASETEADSLTDASRTESESDSN